MGADGVAPSGQAVRTALLPPHAQSAQDPRDALDCRRERAGGCGAARTEERRRSDQGRRQM